MHEGKVQTLFFYGLLIGLAVLVFFIFQPFLSTLFLALTLAIVFRPVNDKISALLGNYRSIASIISVLIICLLIIAPLTFFSVQIFEDGKEIYNSYFGSGENASPVAEIIDNFLDQASAWLGSSTINIDQAREESLRWLLQNFNILFTGLAWILLNIFVLIISLFYLLRDTEKLKGSFLHASPLTNKENIEVIHKIEGTINAVVRGSLLIALLQGLLTGIGFYLFSLPQPIFWGSIAAILSLIPSVGTALVMVPAAIILFLSGSILPAIAILIWNFIVVGPVDNILRPILIQKGMGIHPILVLISVLGGVAMLGPVGFVIGPVIFSLFSSLLKIYLDFREKTS
jgi:predicted PurR-regulated permease PerM